jgi:hypothetical protein
MNTLAIRKSRRVHFVCQADIAIDDKCFEAVTDNISLDGIFIKTDSQIPVGNYGRISVKRDKNIIVSANCIVVRNDRSGFGAQFKALDYDSFSQIKALVLRHPSCTV